MRFVKVPDHLAPQYDFCSDEMRLVPLTQRKFAFVDAKDFARVSKFKWSATRHKSGIWYASTNRDYKTLLLHRFILSEPNYQIDHRNRNGLDCRKQNLRIATASQNGANSKLRSNVSGAKGIDWVKRDQLWRVRIRVHPNRILLGYFKRLAAAKEIYRQASVFFFNDFSRCV